MNVEAELAKFDAVCDRWIAALDGYDDASWRRVPAAGVWSMSQVYAHIIEVGSFGVEKVAKCGERAPAKSQKTLAGHLVYWFGSLPPLRIKAPAGVNSAPAEPESKASAREALLAIRSRMHALAPTVHAARGVATHPILGKLTATEWFRFMEMHLRHHLRQKERIDAMLASNEARRP